MYISDNDLHLLPADEIPDGATVHAYGTEGTFHIVHKPSGDRWGGVVTWAEGDTVHGITVAGATEVQLLSPLPQPLEVEEPSPWGWVPECLRFWE